MEFGESFTTLFMGVGRRGKIFTYSYAQDMVTSSSLYYTPKTTAAEIARPGSEWRWMGWVCGWVHAWKVYAPQGRARVESIGSADHLWEGSSMDASNTAL